MSLYDWQRARVLRAADEPFAALIMAAVMKADSSNLAKLQTAFPEIVREADRRYHSRQALETEAGGLLPGALPEDMP